MGAGEEQSDVEALRITREESRAVLDHRIAPLNDLDDKAIEIDGLGERAPVCPLPPSPRR